ncbi:COP9 signalosome complex subunit 8 [Durusdinium trenchii]|uniref:COP9 signalosome complex subunit 8 n=1 Tax=Durusdinium trenchii TaxID=1381693 RepID=A0ABP0LSC6_9DINO
MTLTLEHQTLRMLIFEHCCASDEQCLDLLVLQCTCRWWQKQFKQRIEPLYGFALPAVAHVAMHWGMFTEHGVISTRNWQDDSEVVWITDPDEDHGDFEGSSEGSRISPWPAYQLWHALMKRVCAWHSSQGKPQPFGQGLEACRLQLGPRSRRLDIEVFQPSSETIWMMRRMAPAEREVAMKNHLPSFKTLCCQFLRSDQRRVVKGTAADGARLSRLCPFEARHLRVQPLHLFRPSTPSETDPGDPVVDLGVEKSFRPNCWQM